MIRKISINTKSKKKNTSERNKEAQNYITYNLQTTTTYHKNT